MIDLRSDTLTKPSREMLKEMANAELGDDVFGEDPTTNQLQETLAGMFGKEEALFVSSGVMGNQLGIKSLTEPGDEIIVEAQSHIFFYETAAPSIISNVQIRPVVSVSGQMEISDIEAAIRPSDYYFPKTKLICVENTHNRHSGSILDINYIRELYRFAKSRNLFLHIDGARIWNAIVATGVEPQEWGGVCDSISVCFSKGLGAPIGSALISTQERINIAHRWRKILGGGMRQTGVLAAAGLYAIKNNLGKLADDHANARKFAVKLNEHKNIDVDLSKVQTNIVCFDLTENIDTNVFLEECKKDGLLMLPFGPKTIRAVFNYHIDSTQTDKAIEIINKHIADK